MIKEVNKTVALICMIVLVMSFIFLPFFKPAITANVITLDKEYSETNETIKGNFTLTFKEGELIPADAIIKISMDSRINNQTKEKELSFDEFIELSVSCNPALEKQEGNFYIHNKNISGSGDGYGWPGQFNETDGFGQDYLTDETHEIILILDKLDLKTEKTGEHILTISLTYQEVEIIKEETSFTTELEEENTSGKENITEDEKDANEEQEQNYSEYKESNENNRSEKQDNGNQTNFETNETSLHSLESGTFYLDGCKTISEDGIYILSENVKTSKDICFNITADNVTLDCNNHVISLGKPGKGIFSDNENNVIKNCMIKQSNYAVHAPLYHESQYKHAIITTINIPGYIIQKSDNTFNYTIEGFYHNPTAGEPKLPEKIYHIEVPNSAYNLDVDMIDSSPVNLGIIENIELVQEEVPFDFSGNIPKKTDTSENEFSEKNLEVYENLGETNLRNHKVLILKVNPFVFNKKTNELVFHEKITFKISYDIDRALKELRSEQISEDYEAFAKSLIINYKEPEMVLTSKAVDRGAVEESPLGYLDSIDYIIITSEDYQEEFQRLADWKTQKGIPTRVYNTSWIYANYEGDYANDSQDKIRTFIKDMYNTYSVTYVLLGGDTDIVPDRDVYASASGYTYFDIPGDLYYSDLDGTWDADGDLIYGETSDNTNLYPDVFTGRAPVNSLNKAQIFVNKTLNYEKNPPAENYSKDVLFLAELCEYSKNNIGNYYIPGSFNLIKKYKNTGTLNLTIAIDALNSGCNLVDHYGHGGSGGIAVNGGFGREHADSLTNQNEQSIFYSVSCGSAWFDTDCFAEHMLNNPNGGAVVYIGNARIGWSGSSIYYDEKFFEVLFDENYYKLGQAFAESKAYFAGSSGGDTTRRQIQLNLNLLGDPELNILTENPENFTVVYTKIPRINSTEFIINVKKLSNNENVENAKVVLWKKNQFYNTLTTSANGNASVFLNVSVLENVTLTVYKHNYYPLIETLDINTTGCIIPSSGNEINTGVSFCSGTYNIAPGFNVTASDIIINCNGSVLNGTSETTAFYIHEQQNVTLKNCTIKNYEKGVFISNSNFSNLTNIKFENNAYNLFIKGNSLNEFNQIIDTSNTINGKPVYYKQNIQDNTYTGAVGFFACINCNNVTIKNTILSNNSHGILLWNTNNSFIRNATLTGNYYGAVIASSNNSLTNNTFNQLRNLHFNSSSNNNFVYNNSFYNGSVYHINNSGLNNEFNTSFGGAAQGNYYDDINEWSIFDMSGPDGYGDFGADYPYNASQTKWFGNGADWGPKTDKAPPLIIDSEIFPEPAYTNDSLNCSAIPIDKNYLNLNVSFTWYKDDINMPDWNTIVACINGTDCYTNILVPNLNTTKDDKWICSAKFYNGFEHSAWTNSSQLTISNTQPTTPVLHFPGNATNQTNVFLNYSSLDLDNDTITYHVYGSTNPDSLEIIYSGTSRSYGWTGLTPGETYYLKLKASDGTDNSSVSDVWTFDYYGCGTLLSNFTLNTNLSANSTCFTTGANNIILDCDGYSINGNTFNSGINNPGFNNIIVKNCFISNFKYGIFYRGANSEITDNTIENNTYYGIYFTQSLNNTLTNNIISSNSGHGIYLTGSNNNTIYNNYFNNTINVEDDGTNYWNITKTLGTNIMGYQYLGGNFWSDYGGKDFSGDKLGDTYLPYNGTASIHHGGDWHPLTKATTNSGSSGGGGGGISYKTLTTVAVTKKLTKGNTFNFKISKKKHTFTLQNIYENAVNVKITSTPIEANVSVGETKTFDLDDDGFEELSVTLTEITNNKNKAILDFELLAEAEEAAEETGGAEEQLNNKTEEFPTGILPEKEFEPPSLSIEIKTKAPSWGWLLLLLIPVVLILYLICQKKKKFADAH